MLSPDMECLIQDLAGISVKISGSQEFPVPPCVVNGRYPWTFSQVTMDWLIALIQ